MRSGILDKVPGNFPKDRIVFLVGNENEPAVKHLKTTIANMNRMDNWIQAEWRPNVRGVPDRAGVMLVMSGVTNGTLATIRKDADGKGVPYPYPALTVSEVKQVLEMIEDMRGRSDDSTQKEGIETSQEENPQEGVAEPNPTPTQTKSRVDVALETIDRFKALAEETQLAVMELGDELADTTSKLGSKEKELETEKGRVATLTSENTSLREDNERLRQENLRLQGTLDNLSNLIKIAKGE